jgi:hypothetical protein
MSADTVYPVSRAETQKAQTAQDWNNVSSPRAHTIVHTWQVRTLQIWLVDNGGVLR